MAAKSGLTSAKGRRNKSLYDAGLVDGDEEPGGSESQPGNTFKDNHNE